MKLCFTIANENSCHPDSLKITCYESLRVPCRRPQTPIQIGV